MQGPHLHRHAATPPLVHRAASSVDGRPDKEAEVQEPVDLYGPAVPPAEEVATADADQHSISKLNISVKLPLGQAAGLPGMVLAFVNEKALESGHPSEVVLLPTVRHAEFGEVGGEFDQKPRLELLHEEVQTHQFNGATEGPFFIAPGTGGSAQPGQTLEQAQQELGHLRSDQVRLVTSLDIGEARPISELSDLAPVFVKKEDLEGHRIKPSASLVVPEFESAVDEQYETPNSIYRFQESSHLAEESRDFTITPTSKLEKVLGRLGMLRRVAVATLPPALGSLVAGPPGFLVGVGVSAVLGFVSEKDENLRGRLVGGALSGVMGLISGVNLLPALAGTLGTGIAAVCVAAGLYKTAKTDTLPHEKVQIKPERFAPPYEKRVEKLLNEAGKSLNIESEEPSERIAQIFKQATKHLSPKVATELAGEVSKELIGGHEANQIESLVYPYASAVSPVNFAGEPAHASLGHVVVPPQYQQMSETAHDVVLGHEISHVKNRDVLRQLGQESIRQALMVSADNGGLAAKVGAWFWQRKLDIGVAEVSQEIETRCDRDGATFALEKGHSPEQVAEAGGQIFKGLDLNNRLSSHPKNELRRQVLSEAFSEERSQPGE